jgi:hypothetical protein
VAHCEHAFALYSLLGLPVETAEACAALSGAYARALRIDDAYRAGEQAQALFVAAGYELGIQNVRDRLSLIAWSSGDFERSRGLVRELIEAQKQKGRVPADAWHNGALTEAACGDYPAARACCINAYAQSRAENNMRVLVPSCVQRCYVELLLDEPADALHFAQLARDNYLDKHTGESVIQPLSYAVAALANGMLAEARQTWDGAPDAVAEVAGCSCDRITHKALEHVLARSFWGSYDDPSEALALGRQWLREINSSECGCCG